MSGQLTRFQHFVNVITTLYLILMLVYLLARFVIQDRFWPLSFVNSFAFVLFLPLPFLLFLALLARSRRALLRLLPIILLLIVWFGPRFLPKTVASSTAPTLRVMTNNIWRLNPTSEAVTRLVAASNPDVIFLQEVQLSTQQDAITALNTNYPYQTSLTDEIRLGMYTAVNLTFSRYPFVISEKIELDLPGMPFIYRNVIEVNRQRVALYNVHLVAPIGGSSRPQPSDNYIVQAVFGFDDRQRNQQIETLLAHLAAEPYPYIIAGDFNTSDLSMTYNLLASQMRDTFNDAGTGFGGSWPMVEALGWPSFIPPMVRMDYIWHSSGLQTVKAWQGDFTGSDHLPILADLAFDSQR
jgi:vancomycin resistance protein VanJ